MDALAVNPGLIRTGQELFRIAAAPERFTDSACWLAQDGARSRISHIFDGDLAVRVYNPTPVFPEEVRELTTRLNHAA